MRIRLMSILVIALLLAACQSVQPSTQIVMEVTRVVTVVVTPPAEETSEATADVQGAESTETVEAGPTQTPTPDNFPTPVVGQVYVAEQAFQHGRMFWLEPSEQIWVLARDEKGVNRWLVYNNTWNDSQPESDESIVPPEPGLYQPIRGFGKLWRENQVVRDLLGWAVDPEFGHVTRYEFRAGGSVDENGVYTPALGYHLLTALNGDVLQIEESTKTWKKIN